MKTKQQILTEIYNLDITFFILVETFHEGVLIPNKFYEEDTLLLKLSSYFKNFVEFDNAEIKTILSFSGKEENVIIPYEAIKAIYDKTHTYYYVF